MVYVKKEGVLLESTDLEFENQAVLNPTCIQEGNIVHMFYRAVKEGNYSSVGYLKLDGPMNIVERKTEPVLTYEFDWEKHGAEDPRIVEFEGLNYLFYTAYDGKNATLALATSKGYDNFEKHGIITPQITYKEATDLFKGGKIKEKYHFFEAYYMHIVGDDVLLWEKDAYIFPKRINGKIALIHRILPDIQIVYFDNFSDLTTEFWRDYLKRLDEHIVLSSKYYYESRNIGGGCPPIETDRGWLLLYHAVQDTDEKKIYHAACALLDKDNPQEVIGHLRRPLFSPETSWEVHGDVDNVVFPTGAAIFDGRIYIYYGAADKRIAVASIDLEELLDELVASNTYHDLRKNIRTSKQDLITEKKHSIETSEKLSENQMDQLLALGWMAREGRVKKIINEENIEFEIKV